MLIRDAEIGLRDVRDLRIGDGRIRAIAKRLPQRADEPVIEAGGGALLPGLHDHHLHISSLAAALASVPCGPPQVRNAQELVAGVHAAVAEHRAGHGDWIRGVGYHESVAGALDRDILDRWVADRPLRIQHRSGRLWMLNSRALERLQLGPGGDPLERVAGRPTGRLYDADDWLRSRLGGERPSLHTVSQRLARLGVTGITDTSPHNSMTEFRHFAAAQARGELLQDIVVMGDASLDAAQDGAGVQRGAHKFHLHDAELPEFDAICADIRRSHAAGRAAAFHCVTRTDLVFALGALREAGARAGDRIEHAAITPPELMAQIAELGVTVVTQPNFIDERGAVYLEEVEADDQPWLYRLRGFLDAGIPLAGSTDAPFGEANPWSAMQAAVTRRTRDGRSIGANERLTPEQALSLFTSPGDAPGREPRELTVGAPADVCLLDRSWVRAREDLGAVQVRATLRAGEALWRAP